MGRICRVIICCEADVYVALGLVRSLLGSYFLEMDRQKVLVSSSELLRNILDHANGSGIFLCKLFEEDSRFGIYIRASDSGPGIQDVEQILSGKKKSTSKGLGIGLSCVKRLMDEFHIETSAEGTAITAVKWAGKRRSITCE